MMDEEKIIRVKTLENFDRELARDGDETLEVSAWIAQEYDPREDQELLSFRERSERALAEVGIYRSVSFRDLAEAHFGGHPYMARRAVNRWIRQRLMCEHAVRGPKGGSFQVLTLTRRGAQKASLAAIERDLDPKQRTWSGLWSSAPSSTTTRRCTGPMIGSVAACLRRESPSGAFASTRSSRAPSLNGAIGRGQDTCAPSARRWPG